MGFIPTVLLVATMDTKHVEVGYLVECLGDVGIEVMLMDVGILRDSPIPVSVGRERVAEAAGCRLEDIGRSGLEGEALDVMSTGAIRCAQELFREKRIQGILSLGGSMGTDIGTRVMRAFPVGFPKVMISTLASHDTRPFVKTKDIVMIPAVCDLSGLNRITERILTNAALAIAGMVKFARSYTDALRPLVLVTTLGTIEPCAIQVKKALERKGREVVIFHTTGTGGQAMEETIEREEVESLIDLSLQEIVAHLLGGEYDAGPSRGLAALEAGIPTVLVPGTFDFVVSGPLSMARKHFPNRHYHIHNAAITCVRTTHEDLVMLAKKIAGLCTSASAKTAIAVPLKGFSGFDQPGGPLYDPEGPRIFSEILKQELPANIDLSLLPYHIIDAQFAAALVRLTEGF